MLVEGVLFGFECNRFVNSKTSNAYLRCPMYKPLFVLANSSPKIILGCLDLLW